MIERPKRQSPRAAGSGVKQNNSNPKGIAGTPETQPEASEHGSERRRFLIWCLMAGYIKPERVTDRIVAEIEREAAS